MQFIYLFIYLFICGLFNDVEINYLGQICDTTLAVGELGLK